MQDVTERGHPRPGWPTSGSAIAGSWFDERLRGSTSGYHREVRQGRSSVDLEIGRGRCEAAAEVGGLAVIWRKLGNRNKVLLIGGLLLASAPMRLWGQTAGFVDQRRSMVEEQILRRGVSERKVLSAMEEVPRHVFVPEPLRDQAYADGPLSIGSGQTISQPYIVALMTSLLELDGDERVLEIGTGSGYQAAVLSRLVKDVYTIEIREELGQKAQQTLDDLGYTNVHFKIGDGYQGWPEAAPFDGIMVTAAPDRVPEPLIDQLKVGGKLVIPVGDFFQDLLVVTKTADGIQQREIIPVRFVPMIGEVEGDKSDGR